MLFTWNNEIPRRVAAIPPCIKSGWKRRLYTLFQFAADKHRNCLKEVIMEIQCVQGWIPPAHSGRGKQTIRRWWDDIKWNSLISQIQDHKPRVVKNRKKRTKPWNGREQRCLKSQVTNVEVCITSSVQILIGFVILYWQLFLFLSFTLICLVQITI